MDAVVQQQTKRSKWSKYILAGVTVLLINIFLPGHKGQYADISVGDTWNSKNLVAEQDFSLLQSKDDISKLRSELEVTTPIIISKIVKTEGLGDLIVNDNPIYNTQSQNIQSILSNFSGQYILPEVQENAKYGYVDNDELKIIPNEALVSISSLQAKLSSELIALGYDKSDVNLTLSRVLATNTEIDYQARENLIQSSIDKLNTEGQTYKKGRVLVHANKLLSRKDIQVINSYDKAITPWWAGWNRHLGFFLLTTMIITILTLYLQKYFPKVWSSYSSMMFVFLWPLLFAFLTFLIEHISGLSPYLIPYCIVPIVVLNFYNGRLALFIHIVVILIASCISYQGYEFTFLQILTGILTVLIISETRIWNSFFIAILIILGVYLMGHTGLSLLKSDFQIMSLLSDFGWLSMNALLLLLAYPFIPLFERLFGFTSSITLQELADMNHPLMKELSMKAPGTLQHSLMVANLAEAAADKINANSLLVKTAAYYHDIGKTKQPEYYVENSKGSNLHDHLNDNFRSAEIIIEHVTEGVKMAKAGKLPKPIIDFINTHHGDSRVEYFYRKQLKDHPEREFDESLFRYPGKKPQTKEQAILMMADTIEAACRSLKDPTEDKISEFIDKIINGKIEHGQFDESNLSFAEMDLCRNVFKEKIQSMNHQRIEYPDQKK